MPTMILIITAGQVGSEAGSGHYPSA